MRLFGLFCIHAAIHYFIACYSIWILQIWVWIELFESISKMQSISFSFFFSLVFSPAHLPSPFSFLLFSSRPSRPPPAHLLLPARPAPPPLSHRHCHADPARQSLLLPRVRHGLKESSQGTRGCVLVGAHAKAPGHPLFKVPRTPPWIPSSSRRPLQQTLRRRPSRLTHSRRWISIQGPRLDLIQVKIPWYRSTLGVFAKKPLSFTKINPHSTTVQK